MGKATGERNNDDDDDGATQTTTSTQSIRLEYRMGLLVLQLAKNLPLLENENLVVIALFL